MSITQCSIDGCTKEKIARGWCVKHYRRYLRRGDPNLCHYTGEKPETFGEVLIRCVPTRISGECWVWAGHANKGYGVINKGHPQQAHRYVYEHMIGPIPEGMDLLHSCDNPPCVNPDHLHPGTHAQNMHECVSRNRRPHGSKQWKAKLDEAAVYRMRREHKAGNVGLTKFAKEYGVTVGAIYKAVSGRSWKHVEMP